MFVRPSTALARPLAIVGQCLHGSGSQKIVIFGSPYRWLATGLQRNQNFNVGRFDLPKETPDADAFRLDPKVDSTFATEEETQRMVVKLSEVTSEDVVAHWPPKAFIDTASAVTPVKRRDLWTTDEELVGIEDVGRFVKLSRDTLINYLPEGACGELPRDLALIPSPTRPVGLMLRKLTIELMLQLEQLRDATDLEGVPCIPKAGFLIDGRRGTGKSQVLNMLAIWARKNGWLVILEPVPGRYSTEIADIKRSNAGVYIQNEFAQQFLEATSIANREILENIPVDLKAYGSRAIDGEPIVETRRLYDPLIQKTVEQEVSERGLSGAERLRRIAAYKKQVRVPSMAQHLKDPMNVWEIVEFGLDNEVFATQAVAEMFVQLQRQTEYPVLVIVDEWNECFPVSQYVSIRYDNTRFHGYIPAYHLTMPRTFRRWDGHVYRRGLKIHATSWMRSQRRDYKPELLGVKKHELRTVRNFSQHEFANFVAYYRMMNILHNFPRDDLEHFYMMTQGNGWQARRLLTTLY